ncbi:MAG TPA: hypothetical protein VHT75_20275 [Acidimicrobiales bacterium]|jgi:hypothetical protein|nr:hypothetical protein [Acidimicrobiales bacterium]
MSDAIQIERGRPPWQPSSSATLVSVLHRYTIPLVGVLDQHGSQYLFWCLVGHAAPDSAWAYAQISPEDVASFALATHETFDATLREAVGDRVCTFAVASDEKGIIESVILHPPATFDTAQERGMAEMAEKFREVFEQFQLLSERFPSLQAAAHFDLVPTGHLD